MSKSQLENNMKIQSEFLAALVGLAARALPFLASAAKNILPALGIGALSDLASSGTQKAVGNGLYLKKGGCVCQIETDCKGIYLGPAKGSGLESAGDGLYLKQNGSWAGKGSLSNILKNVPIIGMLI